MSFQTQSYNLGFQKEAGMQDKDHLYDELYILILDLHIHTLSHLPELSNHTDNIGYDSLCLYCKQAVVFDPNSECESAVHSYLLERNPCHILNMPYRITLIYVLVVDYREEGILSQPHNKRSWVQIVNLQMQSGYGNLSDVQNKYRHWVIFYMHCTLSYFVN